VYPATQVYPEIPAAPVNPATQVYPEIPAAPVNPDYRASPASMAPQALKGRVDPRASKDLPVQPALLGLPAPYIPQR